MNCLFQLVKKTPKGYKYRCTYCKFTLYSDHADPTWVHATCRYQGGVGTELKIIIGWINRTKVQCNTCEDRAREMDAKGIAWCEKNRRLILEWLKEGAKDRKLPFNSFLANGAINLAIKKAKKKLSDWEASRLSQSPDHANVLP